MYFGNERIAVRLKHKPVTEYITLLGITIGAACLRVFRLGEWSLWGDEVFSLENVSDGFVRSTSVSLIHLATSYLGTSEWSARLVPAVIGIFSVLLFYFPVKRILGRRVGSLSAALLAVSTWHLYWSQNARFYVLLLLFYTFALLTFYLGLEEDNPWFILSSLILFGLATKERLLAMFFLPVVGSYLLCLQVFPLEKPLGLRWRNLAIFFIPLGLVALIFAFPYLGDVPGWLTSFARVNNNPVWLMAGTFYYIGLPVVALAGFGGLYYLNQGNRTALFFTLGAAIPLLGIMAFSLFQYTANRYIFVSLTSWIILAAMSLDEIYLLLKSNARFLAIGVCILVFGASLSEDFLYFQYQNGNREHWREALQYVRENRRQDDLVVVANPDVGRYYLGDEVIGFNQLANQDLEGLRRVWFIEDLTVEELFPELRSWMENNARLLANFDNHVYARVYVMRVFLFENEDVEIMGLGR